MQVLGVGNDGQKGQQRQRVNPPEGADRRAGVGDEERGQVGGHQDEDQQGDEAGFPGELFAQPFGADEEAADEEAEDADGAGHGEGGGKVEVEAADSARGREKAEAEAHGEVVERDQRKGAEGPEDEGVGQARQRALADDFGLAEHFPDEVADALAEGKRWKPASFLDLRILSRTTPKRRQKAAAEAMVSAAKSSFSTREKCGGSARVTLKSTISERNHNTSKLCASSL